MTVANLPAQQKTSPIQQLAGRLSIDEQVAQEIVMNTLMKAKGNNNTVTNEELVTFLAISNEYGLNPLTKEIYAFNNRGAIQPIVSIDGWLKIINGHSQFDGMEFEDSLDANGQLSSITCRIYRKDRSRATVVSEYLNECRGDSKPWEKWPARMLRHKAAIQCARYAFGLSGIIDEDEAERYKSTNLERDVSPRNGSKLQAALGNSLEETKQDAHPTEQAQDANPFDQAEPEQPTWDVPEDAPSLKIMLESLQYCKTHEDLEDWISNAAKWPDKHPVRNDLRKAYAAHKQALVSGAE